MSENTKLGYSAGFNFSQYEDEEKNILIKLSQEFYLTNSGGVLHLGQSSKYFCFLMKPTDMYREMFNLEREILCIFSPYTSFEPRTLDAFDEAQKKYQSLRIENICRVLISKDPAIESKVADILKSNPELPIVVPFTYSELNSPPNEYFFKNKFRKHFFSRDLFSFNSPLKKDLYFFGRAELIKGIDNRHDSHENSGLFGLRKSGKTSIIYGIMRFLSATDKDYLLIDCQSPGMHQLRWNELLYRLIFMIKDRKQSKSRIEEESKYSVRDAAVLFEKDLLNVYASKKRKPILLIFDEIERISPNTGSAVHWRSDCDFIYFWQTLRSIFQKHREVFSYFLVGTNPSCIETPSFNGHDNPIFSQVQFEYVPPFDIQKTREMVSKLGHYMGLQFDDLIFSKLTEDFGGHPFLIRHVCSEINKLCPSKRPARVDKALYEKAKKRFAMDSVHYMEMIVGVLKESYPDEYEMLKLLAIGEYEDFNEFANGNRYYTGHLVGYGLINQGDSGYSFNIECIKEYILSRYKYENKVLSDKEKRAEVNERRVALEQGLRKIIRKQLKASCGAKNGRGKVIASLSEGMDCAPSTGTLIHQF